MTLASMQTVFSLQNVWIKLTLFDNDVELCSSSGKGTATINNVVLHISDDPAPVKPSKEDKKGASSVAQV